MSADAGDEDVHLPDLHDDAHLHALRARKGRPDGPPIVPDGGEIPKADLYSLATILADLKAAQTPPAAEPAPARRTLVDWTLNIPLMLTIGGMAVTVLVGYVQLGDRVESFGRRLEIVEHRQAENLPRLDAQAQDNRLQDQRIQNIIEGATETRRTVSELAKVVGDQARAIGDMHESLTLMKDRQDRGSGSGLH